MIGWIGVDLDGTLAFYDGWRGEDHIGEPVERMIELVKGFLKDGQQVKIFTARASAIGRTPERRAKNITLVQSWCQKHLGVILEVTSDKDCGMVILYDDRACTVECNTGKVLCGGAFRHFMEDDHAQG